MSDTQEAIRRLSIQTTESGTADATKKLNDLAKAQGGVAVASASTEKATLSLDQKFASIERRYVAQVRAQQDFEKIQKQVNAAVSQNPALQDRANAVLAAAKERHDQLGNSQKALGVITSDLNGRVQAAAGSFGVVGQAISVLGPGGIAAAAGIGTLIAGFNIASDAAHALAAKAKELREFAEATGLTTQQVQALKSEAGKFGIDSETLSAGIQKFTTGFQQLRLGTGDLLTQIRRINPTLADQIQGAQDAATAFTLFGKAVAQTDNIFQRNALLKAGLGKGSAIFGEFFATSPDVAGLTSAFTAAGKGLDENLIKKLALLQVEIDKTRGSASTIFATIFAESVLKSEKEFAGVLLDIAKAFKVISELKFPELPKIPEVPDWVKAAYLRAIPGAGLVSAGASVARGALSSGADAYDRSFRGESPANSYSTFQGAGTSAAGAATGAKTPEALAADLKNLISVLGSAATPSEKLSAAIAELGIRAKEAGVGATELARGVAGLKLDSVIAQQSAHNAALGAAASQADILKLKTLELAKAQEQGAGLTKQQIENAKQVAAAQALGTYQIQTQIDGEKTRLATMFMGAEAATSYATSQAIINKAIQDGKPLNDEEIRQIKEKADALAKVKVQADRYAEALETIKGLGAAFANDLVSGLLSGKSAMDALTASANSLGKSLTTAGINNIIKDPTSAVGYIEAGIGVVTQLVTGNSQKKQAQDAADAARASQYSQRVAAAGVDTSTRAGAEAAQNAQFLQERLAEGKAGAKAWNQLMEAQNAERLALQKQWDDKEIAQLKAKQEAIDARNLSAADRLFAAGNDTSTLAGALAAADRQFAKERADEMKAGGEAINSLIAAQEAERLGIYKQFNDQLIEDAKRAADSIRSYLESLQFGDKSILSPQDQLAAAQSDFSRQLGLAQGGDATAQGSITQYASTLLDQAKSYYASSSGYADIYKAVTSALSGLIGSSATSSPTADGSAMPAGSLSGIIPSVSLQSAGNDNSALFASQTQSLVQAIASVGNAQIQALREEVGALRTQNGQLIKAVQDLRSNGFGRPLDRSA